MDREDLIARTKQMALRVLKVVDALPRTPAGRAIANQLVRCGTSVAANYRAAKRSRSRKEFVSKISLVTEEADETWFWLDLIIDAKLLPARRIEALRQEADELTRIFSKTRKTAAKPQITKSTITKSNLE